MSYIFITDLEFSFVRATSGHHFHRIWSTLAGNDQVSGLCALCLSKAVMTRMEYWGSTQVFHSWNLDRTRKTMGVMLAREDHAVH